MEERVESWNIALSMWLDPAHFIQGVGLQNAPWWMIYYEPPERRVRTHSLAGRALHSMYFELCADMGLYGIVLVGTIFGSCILACYRLRRRANLIQNRVSVFLDKINRTLFSKEENREAESNASLELKLLGEALASLSAELSLVDAMFRGASAAWIGVLVAGIGISVLYYPPLWALVGLSVAIQIYFGRLEGLAQGIAKKAAWHLSAVDTTFM